MLPAITSLARLFYVLAVLGAFMFAQAADDSASSFDPDLKSVVKLKALLAFLGLIILFIGMFLIVWLIGLHIKRNYLSDPHPSGNPPFSEFGYKHQSQRKAKDTDEER